MQCGLDNKRSRCVVSHRFSDLNNLSTLLILLIQRTMISESCDASRLQIVCEQAICVQPHTREIKLFLGSLHVAIINSLKQTKHQDSAAADQQ